MGLTNYSLGISPPTEPPQPSPPSEGQGGPEDSNSLDKLVQSIYNSVAFAQRKVETEHLGRVMSTYFDSDGNAKTFKVKLPGNNGEVTETHIPLITLTNNAHLAIDELEMELAVNLSHFEDEINNNNNHDLNDHPLMHEYIKLFFLLFFLYLRLIFYKLFLNYLIIHYF